MKKSLIILLLTVGLAGCTPEDRIDGLRTQVEHAQGILAQINAALPQLEATADELRAVLNDPSIDEATRERALALLVNAESKADQYRRLEATTTANLDKLGDAIRTLQDGGTITQWDELQLYGQIGSTVGRHLPPPWGGYVVLGSSLLTLIGGLLGGKYKQQLADREQLDFADRTTVELVYSVDKLLEGLSDEQRAAAKAALKSAQSPDTRAAVAKIKT